MMRNFFLIYRILIYWARYVYMFGWEFMLGDFVVLGFEGLEYFGGYF